MLVPSWGPISSQHALDYVQKEIKYRLRCSAALYGSSLRESSSRQSGTSAPVSIVFPESLLHSQWCALVLIPRFGRMGSLTTCNGSRAALIFPAALSEPAESTFTNTAMSPASQPKSVVGGKLIAGRSGLSRKPPSRNQARFPPWLSTSLPALVGNPRRCASPNSYRLENLHTRLANYIRVLFALEDHAACQSGVKRPSAYGHRICDRRVLPANLHKNKEPTSGPEPLTCSLRVRSHTFVGVPHCSKNRLLKPSLPIPRFPMFAVVRPGYCHGYCQTAAAVQRCSATHFLLLLPE